MGISGKEDIMRVGIKIFDHLPLLLLLAVMLASCVNTLEVVTPRGGERVVSHEGAVADAKAYFDTHFGQNTRSNNQTPSHEAPYVVGNLIPDWESGV